MRSGTSPLRINHPLTFYPLFVSEDGKKIVRVGEPLTPGVNRNTVKADKGTKVGENKVFEAFPEWGTI